MKNNNENNKGKIIQIKNSFYLFVGENIKNKLVLNIYLISINEYNINDNNDEQINIIKVKEIFLNGDYFMTSIKITNNYDLIISLSNGTICIYNHSNKNPEYYFIYHHQKVTNFIWFEKQKTIISVSLDKSIKIFQIPLKWPAELIRINKRINNTNIIKDIIGDTKNIFYEMKYNMNNKEEENLQNNIDTENNCDENKNEKIKKAYIWDIGSLSMNGEEEKFVNNFLNSLDDNIKEIDILNSNDNKIFNENQYKEYKYNNKGPYHDYFNIFSDDLDGWSE